MDRGYWPVLYRELQLAGMKISREVLLIGFWLLLAALLLAQISPGEVQLPYAEY